MALVTGLMGRRIKPLPKRLPAGAAYVVEGRRDKRGDLRVSSRYVALPDGTRIELSQAQVVQIPVAAQRQRVHRRRSGRTIRGPKKDVTPVKIFSLAAGTRQTKRR